MAKTLNITNQAEWDAASRDERLEFLCGDVWTGASAELRDELRAAYDKGLADGLAARERREAQEWRAAA